MDCKAVTDFLWDRLKADDNGKFKDENAIHDIFFPRNSTTNDIAWDESNLWLIDERMVFQQFAASDTSLRSHGLRTHKLQRSRKSVCAGDTISVVIEAHTKCVISSKTQRSVFENCEEKQHITARTRNHKCKQNRKVKLASKIQKFHRCSKVMPR